MELNVNINSVGGKCWANNFLFCQAPSLESESQNLGSWILIEFNSLDGKIRLARVDWWVASSSVHFLGVISNQSCSRPRLHCKANSLCCARQWQLTSFAFRLHFQFASSIIRRATLSAFHGNCLSLLFESFWTVGYKDRLSNCAERLLNYWKK